MDEQEIETYEGSNIGFTGLILGVAMLILGLILGLINKIREKK